MEEMVGYIMNPDNKESSHSTKGYAMPVALARLNEREMRHGTSDRELIASTASEAQWALASHKALVKSASTQGASLKFTLKKLLLSVSLALAGVRISVVINLLSTDLL